MSESLPALVMAMGARVDMVLLPDQIRFIEEVFTEEGTTRMPGISVDPAPVTYEDYYCGCMRHGCECVALTRAQWEALPKAGPEQ